MSLRGALRRLAGSLSRRRAHAELDEEIRFHIEMETEENLRRGLAPDQARRAAMRSFGRVGHTKSAYQEARGLPWLEDVAGDTRIALRTIRRTPAFSAAVIGLMALGIGANAAVFTVVDGVLLRPLPYPRADQIAQLEQVHRQWSGPQHDGATAVALRRSNDETQAIAAIGATVGLNLVDGQQALHVRAAPVSHEYFAVLGVGPAAGRRFEPADERPGAPPRAILGHDLARRLGGDVVGRRLLLGGVAHEVVGVLPAGAALDRTVDLLLPFHPGVESRGMNYHLIGRLRRGAATADQRLAAVTAELQRAGQLSREAHLGWRNLHDAVSARSRPTLLLLFAAVGLVLLIACANVAGLLLIRAQQRATELAVRSALGARPGRLVRQLLTESMVFAIAGGVLGAILAGWALDVLLHLAPAELADPGLGIDHRALLYSLALTAATGFACGLAPALRASRVDLRSAVAGAATGVAASAPRGRWRRSLLVGQVALSTLLLLGAGLLTRTVLALRSVDLGFRPGSIAALTMSADKADARLETFYAQAMERARAVPGVRAVALASGVPGRRELNLALRIPTREPTVTAIGWRYVSPGYFAMLGIRVEAGRALGERDTAAALPVMVVNHAFARRYFPAGDAIGKQIELYREAAEDATDRPRTIVGVVGDTRDASLRDEPEPTVYVAVAQVPPALFALSHRFYDMCWLVDSDLAPAELAARLGPAFRALDPGLPFSEVTRLDAVVDQHLAGERFLAWLLAAFAVAALCIAVTGIYGVAASSVSQRSREIAIRMALGASPGRVMRGILGEGLAVAALGIAIGLVAAWPLRPLLASFLYRAAGMDPVTAGAVAAVLLAAALGASLAPAARAARIDPAANLRQG